MVTRRSIGKVCPDAVTTYDAVKRGMMQLPKRAVVGAGPGASKVKVVVEPE
jgi:hypothetical protein